MNKHHTKYKGDTAVAAVVFDLTKKGFFLSQPLSENSPYDLVCDTGEELLKVQVKFRGGDPVEIPHKTTWADVNGSHVNEYSEKSFDYFAMVSGDYSKIAYVPLCHKGKQIYWEYPKDSKRKFLFWEDFKDFNREGSERFDYIGGASLLDIHTMTREEFRGILRASKDEYSVRRSMGISYNVYKKLLHKYELDYVKDT